jgi:bifunctional DNA-binding transcriptional regulator/antitoxin component of YhaV-PrlF toxin-antitoxin module
MVVGKIGPQYRLTIPNAFRERFSEGQEVAISTDAQGRLIVTPMDQVQQALMETFGMWSRRSDVPNGIDYMNEVRRGRRLTSTEPIIDEAD